MTFHLHTLAEVVDFVLKEADALAKTHLRFGELTDVSHDRFRVDQAARPHLVFHVAVVAVIAQELRQVRELVANCGAMLLRGLRTRITTVRFVRIV